MDKLNEHPEKDRSNDGDLLRSVFQGKWRLRVLQELVKGPIRLSELRRTIPDCSKKVLIDTLHGLVELGWIERREYPTKIKRVEYSLRVMSEQEIRRAVATASSESSEAAGLFTSD